MADKASGIAASRPRVNSSSSLAAPLAVRLAAARQSGKFVEREVEAFIKAWDIEATEALATANRDLVKSQGIAAYARDAQARKRGQTHLKANS